MNPKRTIFTSTSDPRLVWEGKISTGIVPNSADVACILFVSCSSAGAGFRSGLSTSAGSLLWIGIHIHSYTLQAWCCHFLSPLIARSLVCRVVSTIIAGIIATIVIVQFLCHLIIAIRREISGDTLFPCWYDIYTLTSAPVVLWRTAPALPRLLERL